MEQNNLPTGGKFHLLAEGVQELREEVKWYLTFSNEEVFCGGGLTLRQKREEFQLPLPPPMLPRQPPYQSLNPRIDPHSS